MSGTVIQRLGAAAMLVAAALWVVLVTVLPSPSTFATDAALEHAAVVAAEPHPVGSARQAEVADYLMAELDEMGVAAEVVVDRIVRNVVARLDGSDPTGTVLVVTHFDSVPEGSGAGDNATGTAVVLEVVRTLAMSGHRNDVVVLFEDGEERGYFGSRSFAQTSPAIPDIDAVVGVDTGAWGPSYVLEVGPSDGAVLDALESMGPPPLGDSLFTAVNIDIGDDDHEATLFMDLGIPGIAIEDIAASSRKHTAADTLDGVRPAAVAHLGARVEGVVLGLADAELTRGGGDSVWFRLPFFGVVSHPPWLWWVAAALGLAGLVTAAVLRRDDLAWRRIGAMTLRTAGAVASVAVVGTIATASFEVSNGTGLNVQPSLMWVWAVGHLAVAAAVTALLTLPAVRRAQPLEAVLGVAVVLVLFTLVMGGLLPRSGYAFAWPLLLVGLAAFGLVLRPGAGASAMLPAAVAAVLLMGPALVAGYHGSGLTVLGPLALFVALVASLAVPALAPRTEAKAATG